MGSMIIAVLIDVTPMDGLVPEGMTLELGVFGADASIDDVHINTLTTGRVVLVESGSSETGFGTVGDTGETLGDSGTTNHATRAGLRNIPMEQSAECQGCEQRSIVRRRQLLASP